jgi:gluconokinase
MSHGTPLTDEDREPWLERIRTTAEHIVAQQEVEDEAEAQRRVGVMVTCSALKRYYRDILRGTHKMKNTVEHREEPPEQLATYFVYIKAEEHLLRERMAQRQGHFMKPIMLDSQLATLESPEGEAGVVVVPLDKTTEEQVEIALDGLRKEIGDLEFESSKRHEGPEELNVEAQKLNDRHYLSAMYSS